MVAVAAAACTSILSLNEYEVGGSCVDRTKNSCFSCEPATNEQLNNACTSARCFPFDEARVPSADATGAMVDVGVDAAPDSAVADIGSDAGVVTDDRPCEEYGKPIFVAGSSAMAGMLEPIGKLLGDTRVLVYLRAPSCDGVTSIFSTTPTLAGTLPVFGHSKTKSCRVTGSQPAHIGISDVGPAKCPAVLDSADIEDFTGPIQVFMFAAPASSDQNSISASAARRVYSLGAASDVAPWTDGTFVMMRQETSGTQITLGGFIGLDTSAWKGHRFSGSTEIAAACANVAPENRNKTVCITSADQKDIAFKTSLKTLAFQAPGQTCGFFPDSDQNAFDKRNVRDGHYVPWAPVHFFARVDETSRVPKDPDVREALNLLTGQTVPSDPNAVFASLKTAGLVPACAMRVRRDRGDEFGPMKKDLPEVPCGCAFENAPPGAALECQRCDASTPCSSAQVCRFGFCEPKS